MSHALRKLLTLPKASGLLYLFLIFGNNCEVNKRRRDTKLITRCFVINQDLSSDIALIKLAGEQLECATILAKRIFILNQYCTVMYNVFTELIYGVILVN